MNKVETLEQNWVEYIGAEPQPYPRWVGYWVPGKGYPRGIVYTEDGYLDQIHSNQFKGVIASLQGENIVQEGLRSRIFIEVGDECYIHQAHEQMQGICSTLYHRYDAHPTVMYSGNKSFHIHIPFRPLAIKSGSYPVRETIISIIEEGRKMGLIKGGVDWDEGVSDDWRRMGRVPNCPHIKARKEGKLRHAIPVEPYWSLNRIIKESKKMLGGIEFALYENDNYEIRKLLKRHDELLKEIEQMPMPYSRREYSGGGGNTLLDTLLQKAPNFKDGRHRTIIYLLVPLLLEGGYAWEEAWHNIAEFVRRSGENPEKYRRTAEYHWTRRDSNGKPFRPMRLNRFFKAFPGLKEYFK